VTAPQPGPLEILLVEDNDDDVEAVRRILARSGIASELHWARDGEEALAFLARRRHAARVGLVLLDLFLPRMDGLDILRAIRGDWTLAAIPVVVLTGSAGDTAIRECLELGSKMYLLKPLDVADVANILQGVRRYWARGAAGRQAA
jgi:CheY-like chemotaxis protein